MNTSPEQIQIARTVLNAFFPFPGHPECSKKAVQGVLDFGLQTNARVAIREAIRNIGKQPDDERLNLCIDTAHSLMWGYAHWADAQADEIIIDCNPAWEFRQLYKRTEIVNWIQKWQEAGGKVFPNGRMVALKSDPVWTQISAFHLPFPPFDLDSGMDVFQVPRIEAEELGLLAKNQVVQSGSVNFDFEEALRNRIEFYFSSAGRRQRLENVLAQGSSMDLLRMAQKCMQNFPELTLDVASEITLLLERALERGFGANLREQTEAYGLLVEAYDSMEQPEKAAVYRRGQLDSLLVWIAKGIPIDFNQRANAYAHAANIYEELDQPEQAACYRQLALDNRDGFTLLGEALEELKSLDGKIEKETGAKILNKLTKAAERIPEKFPERHAEVYRATGEILDAWGDAAQAIEYYQFAILKNPKVGVKRRLDKLLKNSNMSAAANG